MVKPKARPNHRAAVFSLLCLASVGLCLIYLYSSQLSLHSAHIFPSQWDSITSPAIRITLADAVIPGDDWRRIKAECGDDDTKLINEIQGSEYVTGEQNVITTTDGKPGTSHTVSPVRIQASAGADPSTTQYATNVRSLSVTPRFCSDGTMILDVMSANSYPANFTYSPDGCRSDRFSASIPLKNGETKILRRAQASADAPMRVSLITATTLDIPRRPCPQRQAPLLKSNKRLL